MLVEGVGQLWRERGRRVNTQSTLSAMRGRNLVELFEAAGEE